MARRAARGPCARFKDGGRAVKTSRAITIAALIGTVLLLPVIVILGLGLYGSSLTGSFPLDGSSGPELAIEPERVHPGAAITIRGQQWEPRTLARVEMVVQANQPELAADGEVGYRFVALPPVFVGEIIVSRAGTFAMDTQIPTTLPMGAGAAIQFVAEATYRGGEPAGEARVEFEIEPGPAAVNLHVSAEPDGQPAPQALVELRTNQGQLVAAKRTDVQGNVRFEGLPSGASYAVFARLAGFAAGVSVQVTAHEDESTLAEIALTPADHGRLFVAGGAQGASDPGVTVIDLASLSTLDGKPPEPREPVWSLAPDDKRGVVYVAREVATEIQVIDAASGAAREPIPLTFGLDVRASDADGRPIEDAQVSLLWLAQGQLIPVRVATSGADGLARFEHLISGSMYMIQIQADGFHQPGELLPREVIGTHGRVFREVMLATGPADQSASSLLPVADADDTPATALVISDLAVDPVTGLLYAAGSDLSRGHLFVIDPDTARIVHDWGVPAGVGDVAPAGDGRTVFIANRPFATVTRIDVVSGAVEATRRVPAWPESIVVGADGAVYVACMRTGLVTQLDGASLDTRASRQLDEGVSRLLVLPGDDTVLVANAWTDIVTGLDTQDLGIRFLLPVPKSPRAFAFDTANRRLIVGSAEGGTVSIYNADTFDLHRRIVLGMHINDMTTSAPAGG